MANELAKAVQDLADQVTLTVGVENSVIAYVEGVPALIDAAVASATSLPELVAQLGTLKTTLTGSAAAIADAVAHAPQAVPVVPVVPVDPGPAVAVAPVDANGTGTVA